MGKPPTRDRLSVTTTLDRKALQMLQHFTENSHGNRSEAVGKIIRRYAFLLITTNLTAINEMQFRTLCQLMNGLATEDTQDAQHRLNYSVRYALDEQEQFREDIASQEFADETPDTRAKFMAKLDDERTHLVELGKVVETLDKLQCTALLERIEEVFNGGSAHSLEPRCKAVFAKMQTRRKL
jgi:hypothetical protein